MKKPKKVWSIKITKQDDGYLAIVRDCYKKKDVRDYNKEIIDDLKETIKHIQSL